MLRLISRFAGYWLTAAALVLAVVDGAKSIAASAIVLTPVSAGLPLIAAAPDPDAAAAASSWGWLLDLALGEVLALPAVAALAALGFTFLVLGRRRRHPALGYRTA